MALQRKWKCWLLNHVQLCYRTDCSPPGSFVHGILQARILEWVTISFSKRSSWTRSPALKVDFLHLSHQTQKQRLVFWKYLAMGYFYKTVDRGGKLWDISHQLTGLAGWPESPSIPGCHYEIRIENTGRNTVGWPRSHTTSRILLAHYK